MQITKVESSNITEIGYEVKAMDVGPETVSVGTLRVTFKGGNIYEYASVPLGTYNAFLAAESKGKYFQANIRDKYETKKVEPEAKKDVEVKP
jgi:hypothetical protein